MNCNSYPVMVTIQCLAYNHEPYIRQCLDGFVMQKTDFPFEAIVHDDASTDGTANIIKEYAEKYPDIIKPIFEDENQFSKKKGFVSRIMKDGSRGKYIAICEGDDYWIDPNKLQKQVDYLESHPNVSYVFTGRYVDEVSKCVRFQHVYKNKIYRTKDILGGFNPGLQTVCFKRQCLDALDKYSGINGDRLYPYYASLLGDIVCINDITAVYRKTGKGVSTRVNENDRFLHASKDLYAFHQAVNYHGKKAFLVGMSHYVGPYMKIYPRRRILHFFQDVFKNVHSINPSITFFDCVVIIFLMVKTKLQKTMGWGLIRSKRF